MKRRKPKFKARDLELINRTHYKTRDLRAFLLAGIRANGCTQRKRIEVKYSHHRKHWGWATLGRDVEVGNPAAGTTKTVKIEGANVMLTVPKNPAMLNLTEFAQTLIHELDHSLGFNHADMQPWDTIPVPWSESLSIGLKTVNGMTAEARRAERVAKREAHARAMVERWTKKLATAKRQLSKWSRVVKGYERRKAAKT